MIPRDRHLPRCADCHNMTPVPAESGIVACAVMLDYRRQDQPADCGYYLPRSAEAFAARLR